MMPYGMLLLLLLLLLLHCCFVQCLVLLTLRLPPVRRKAADSVLCIIVWVGARQLPLWLPVLVSWPDPSGPRLQGPRGQQHVGSLR